MPCDFPGPFRTRACQADRSDLGPQSSYAKNLKEPSEIFLENTEKKKQNKTIDPLKLFNGHTFFCWVEFYRVAFPD